MHAPSRARILSSALACVEEHLHLRLGGSASSQLLQRCGVASLSAHCNVAIRSRDVLSWRRRPAISRPIHTAPFLCQSADHSGSERTTTSLSARLAPSGSILSGHFGISPTGDNDQGSELNRWADTGAARDLVQRLENAYPHVAKPTPGQLAFFAALASRASYTRHGEPRDVYYRDRMGMGKTFAISLAAVRLSEGISSSASETSPAHVLILVPSTTLAAQICDHLRRLSPESARSSRCPRGDGRQSRIVVATPQEVERDRIDLPHLTHIFLDEPDAMIGPLPGRRGEKMSTHPFYRHPPSFIKVLDGLLGIRVNRDGSRDFSRRKDVTTVWVGAGLSAGVKRLARTNGWVKRESPIDLDFSHDPPTLSNIRHLALAVDSSSGELSPVETPLSPLKNASADRALPPALVGALARIHASSPEPDGMHALVLPPEGTSLDSLSRQLALLEISSFILTSGQDPPIGTSLLLTRRSAVPGLHIDNLHSIYLLHGLDMAGAPKAVGAAAASRQREAWYDLVTGRLGRLGMVGGGRVMSLVMRGSAEEEGIRRLFEQRGWPTLPEQEELPSDMLTT